MNERSPSKTWRFLFYAVLLCGCVVSCKDEPDAIRGDVQDENFVDERKIREIMGGAASISRSSGRGRETLFSKPIKEVRGVKDEQGKIVFYVINYAPTGFMVMSADNRAAPVLAFSEHDTFVLDESQFSSGLGNWVSYAKDYVKEIRRIDNEVTVAQLDQWSICPVEDVVYPDDIPCEEGCQNQFERVGPLLATAWGQGSGYNNSTPVTGCTAYTNGHAPTGCVATAMAQIMRYHSFPGWYNWGMMPVTASPPFNSAGENEMSRLMYDIGYNVNMDYGCNGSGANSEDQVAQTFVVDFGYGHANYIDYGGTGNYATVENNLRWGQPVVFRGGRRAGSWPFYSYEDGHAWVGDGFSTYFDCQSGTTSLYFHMNWGWNGSNNGWYAFNNFNPAGYTFNYESGVVVNIRP
jgi:hypothetical protein